MAAGLGFAGGEAVSPYCRRALTGSVQSKRVFRVTKGEVAAGRVQPVPAGGSAPHRRCFANGPFTLGNAGLWHVMERDQWRNRFAA